MNTAINPSFGSIHLSTSNSLPKRYTVSLDQNSPGLIRLNDTVLAKQYPALLELEGDLVRLRKMFMAVLDVGLSNSEKVITHYEYLLTVLANERLKNILNGLKLDAENLKGFIAAIDNLKNAWPYVNPGDSKIGIVFYSPKS